MTGNTLTLDLLPSLIRSEFDLIGDIETEWRGAPQGGAGYFVSREYVSKLAESLNDPPDGPEDIIISHAVFRKGGKGFAEILLGKDSTRTPKAENDVVTCHLDVVGGDEKSSRIIYKCSRA